MSALKSTIKLKSLFFFIICAVILCILQPLLAAQVNDSVLDGVSLKAASHASPSREVCESRANDTPEKLLECIKASELWQILAHFQQIADDNREPDGHGYRDTGTPGYKASVQFVAGLAKKAGYTVTVQTYQYEAMKVVGVPEFSTKNQNYVLMSEWSVARLSGGGAVDALIQPAAGPGDGCLQSDFGGFIPGNVALLAQGTCNFDAQVRNAQTAGASAVVIYNTPSAEDDPLGELPDFSDHSAVFAARLTRQASIPVIGVASYKIGSDLLQQYASGNAPQVHIDIRTQLTSGTDYNLIAESPFGDPNHTVVIEGHLDSIFGAGMLDNASGSTTILGIALKLAKTPTQNRLRYIWFGGEELGLLGSAYYTQHLSSDQRKIIAFDLDADVTATPNYDIYVADPATACNVFDFPSNVVPQSKFATQLWADYFKTIGVATGSAPFGNCGTDSNSFALIGIPNTGILTMQDCCKQQAEVNVWGGYLGNYEGNVPGNDGGCCDYPGRWCDNLDNNDPSVFGPVSKATAFMTFELANHAF
jgi:Peptidase family M28/PA domain